MKNVIFCILQNKTLGKTEITTHLNCLLPCSFIVFVRFYVFPKVDLLFWQIFLAFVLSLIIYGV